MAHDLGLFYFYFFSLARQLFIHTHPRLLLNFGSVSIIELISYILQYHFLLIKIKLKVALYVFNLLKYNKIKT